jgi:hypothetical protein
MGEVNRSAKVASSSALKRQRVIDHGEVFTPPGLVNDMLDLVAEECKREDSRFLEPACGDGNFLAEVLRRRLEEVTKKRKSQIQWEVHALLGLACLYGIELLADNTEKCRTRLAAGFAEAYFERWPKSGRKEVAEAAKRIVAVNIVQGDALKMIGPNREPLVLTEWALVGGGKFKRRLFEYAGLTPPKEGDGGLLASEPILDEDGQRQFVPRHIRDLPLVHYLALAKEGDVR